MFFVRGIALGVAVILMGLTQVGSADKRENRLPEKAKAILEKVEQLELLSLDPAMQKEKVKDGFHGWKILGKTVLKGADARKQLLSALEKGISDSDGNGAKCFDPRHGIRASTEEGKTVDLVICFECGWVYVFFDKEEQRGGTAVTTGKPQIAFDKALTDAGVPLPKPARQ